MELITKLITKMHVNRQMELITKLITKMHEYQRANSVTKQCLQNTQYLYDSIKDWPWIQIAPLAVIAYREIDIENEIDGKIVIKRQCYIVNHMVLQISNELLLDPSAEIADQNDFQYVGYDIPKLLKKIKDMGMADTDVKLALKNYLLFKSYAEQMSNGKLFICDKQHYDGQADFINESFLREN